MLIWPLVALVPAVGLGTPISDEALAQKLAPLAAPDASMRLGTAKAVIALGPTHLSTLSRRLQRPLTATPDQLRLLILEIWGQVPNWQSGNPMWIWKPEPPWTAPPRVKGQPLPKRPAPHNHEAVDWLTALNDLDLSRLEFDTLPNKEIVRAEALEVVTLLRAIAAARQMEAVDPLFQAAFMLDGVFRDECGRQIRSMDSYAIAALIAFQHQRGAGLSKQRRYATYQLDRMDRGRPPKAYQAAADDNVRTAILRAYGEARPIDAVDTVLQQVNAPSLRIRREARQAWMQYVSGRAPKQAPKRKRKLAGGKEEAAEKADYLNAREMAFLALQKQLIELGEPVPAKASAKSLTEQLFALYDQRRTAEWDGVLKVGQEHEAALDFAGAVTQYSTILAHDPTYARRSEMAPAFFRRAEELRSQGDPQARIFLRQVVALDPTGAWAKKAQARILFLDGVSAPKPDPEVFERALALDPALSESAQAHARAKEQQALRWTKYGAVATAAMCCLAVLLVWLWRRTRVQHTVAS